MGILTDKVAMVTGASRGIGYAVAEAFGGEGARLSLCARGERQLTEAAEKLQAQGTEVLPFPTDISRADQVTQWVKATIERFGRVDILVNNAGIGRMGPIEDLSEEDWDAVVDIDLKGVFLCSRELFPIMKDQGGGYIINISSVAGKLGFAGSAAYSSAKFGVIGLTESLLAQGKPYNIRATAICPAYVATEMVLPYAGVPAEEMLQPEDIAQTCLFLLSMNPIAVIQEIVISRLGA